MKGAFLTCLMIGFIAINILAYPLTSGRVHTDENVNAGFDLRIDRVAPNAVRVRYFDNDTPGWLPELIYSAPIDTMANAIIVEPIDNGNTVKISDSTGHAVTINHSLIRNCLSEMSVHEAKITISPECNGREYQYGLGQFQDGYTDIFGLSRRLTQVNTQISIPMFISSKGYGILWHNYGLTEFNPCDNKVVFNRQEGKGSKEVVDVTSTEGGKQVIREDNIFTSEIILPEDGDYSLLLDVGKEMASRHNLEIDGVEVIEMKNRWLPPTASKIVHLKKGKHQISAKLTKNDKPVLYYKKVTDNTVLNSPVAESVDYTVFFGSPEEIVNTYRRLTGNAPLMPRWAFGYIHCRERFHNQTELLDVAARFRSERIPVDVIDQDWQYWGKNGWNAMLFDTDNYPDPKQMTDSLHDMNIKLMLSVWAKIDKNSDFGKRMDSDGFFIPGTDWVDFFNPDAATAYWNNFSKNLLPLGIDAWWQDATEPENDDLKGRMICNGKYPGEIFRNVYPLYVNKTVYEGLRNDNPNKRPMILTRCGFSGIQRYGATLWSGDVGSDWESFRRQISSGLGLQAAGIPWWTYDAGGFFRPDDQYDNNDYKQCMLRWIQTSVYLPLMRVHGYGSNTEPWEYGADTQEMIENSIHERYRLLPYIYSNAAEVANAGTTLMRPMIFDFAEDTLALQQKHQYMFGKSLLISPVTEPDVTEWETYLPHNKGGWYDFKTNVHYEGGKNEVSRIDISAIPVFVKAGSILPYAGERQYSADMNDAPIEIRIYPGNDAHFTLYEDDGESMDYLKGERSLIKFQWDDSKRILTIAGREGWYDGISERRLFIISLPGVKEKKKITYNGALVTVQL